MGLITLDEYKVFANIAGDKLNSEISALIKSASQIVIDFLGYDPSSVAMSTYPILLHPGRTVYYLDNPDTKVISLSITNMNGDEKGSPSFFQEDSRVELFGYTPVQGDIATLSTSTTSDGARLESIKLATMLLTKYYYKEEFNKTSVGAGGQTVSYQTGKNFPPHVRAILMQNRIN